MESGRPVTILTAAGEGRHRHVDEDQDADGVGCTKEVRSVVAAGSVVVERHILRAALPSLTHHSQLPPHGDEVQVADDASTVSDAEGMEPALPFSKEVISFALFGRIHPKCSKLVALSELAVSIHPTG